MGLISPIALDDDGAWLLGFRRVASPNCDERPAGAQVSLVVVHGISLPPGQYGGPWIDALFSNCLDAEKDPFFNEIKALCVSAHVLIRRDGELVQYVSFLQRAWHAGLSSFQGQERCNDFSIGIELEGCDDDAYEEAQYQRLSELVLVLKERYPLVNSDAVVGHCHIAPGRKTDPGPAFDWGKLHALCDDDSDTVSR